MKPLEQGRKRALVLFALGLVFLAAVAAILYSLTEWNVPAAARQLENPVPSTAAAIAAGRLVYDQRCQSCHGRNGDGSGDRAAELSVMPTDFTDQAMHHATDGELFWKITHGHRPMPAFRSKLSETERWQVIDYLRTFAAKSAKSPSHP